MRLFLSLILLILCLLVLSYFINLQNNYCLRWNLIINSGKKFIWSSKRNNRRSLIYIGTTSSVGGSRSLKEPHISMFLLLLPCWPGRRAGYKILVIKVSTLNIQFGLFVLIRPRFTRYASSLVFHKVLSSWSHCLIAYFVGPYISC